LHVSNTAIIALGAKLLPDDNCGNARLALSNPENHHSSVSNLIHKYEISVTQLLSVRRSLINRRKPINTTQLWQAL